MHYSYSQPLSPSNQWRLLRGPALKILSIRSLWYIARSWQSRRLIPLLMLLKRMDLPKPKGIEKSLSSCDQLHCLHDISCSVRGPQSSNKSALRIDNGDVTAMINSTFSLPTMARM